jgi:hypothetical protein
MERGMYYADIDQARRDTPIIDKRFKKGHTKADASDSQ